MWTLSSARIVRLLLAPLLSLWVAGAGCLLGCESMVAAASSLNPAAVERSGPSLTIVASGDACSSGQNRSHNCCKKNSKRSQDSKRSPQNSLAESDVRRIETALVFGSESSSGMLGNCPFAVSRTAVISKTRGSDLSITPILVQTIVPSNRVEQTASLSSPLRLPNRGHTYLRCCVFLI